MPKQIRPTVFLKAAKLLQEEINNFDILMCGTPCCVALHCSIAEVNNEKKYLQDTREYKLFEKMFEPNNKDKIYWFGLPSKVDRNGVMSIHVPNQKKRIEALKKAYAKAVKIKEKENGK